MKHFLKILILSLVITLAFTRVPIRGLEVFGAWGCGFPVGFPFAYLWTSRFMPANLVSCMAVAPFPWASFLLDIVIWFLTIWSLIYLIKLKQHSA